MTHRTHTLLIGAGPFGLSLAAYLQRRGLDFRIAGQPMAFWKEHMPAGMYLRSGTNWHLDPDGEHTIAAFLHQQQIPEEAAEPLPLALYLRYTQWLLDQIRPPLLPLRVEQLSRTGTGFAARLDNGEQIEAHRVVIALGLQYFASMPEAVTAALPAGRFSHTCDTVALEPFAGKRVLIIGGRQSAFESAALLLENGARQVHLSYRHETPQFAASDWTWVEDLVAQAEQHPGWFATLTPQEKEAWQYKVWAEGRLKVEPWLASRLDPSRVSLHPQTTVTGSTVTADASVQVHLQPATTIEVDHILLATGYQARVDQIPFLSGPLLPDLEVAGGSPLLDGHFQSSIPGLFFNGFLAARQIGPFMGFTVAAPMAARLIGAALLRAMSS